MNNKKSKGHIISRGNTAQIFMRPEDFFYSEYLVNTLNNIPIRHKNIHPSMLGCINNKEMEDIKC